MNDEQQEETEKALPSDADKESNDSEQDLLKTELENVQRKGRTKAEKLIYTKKRIEEQLKELGVDDEVSADEKPLTLGDLKRIQQETVVKTALDLADEISNPTEKDLTKYHLENTIRSTGNPQKDLELARGLVNAVKNKEVLEEFQRKIPAKTSISNPGAPARTQQQEDFTPEELAYMKPPWNLTKEQIIAARPK